MKHELKTLEDILKVITDENKDDFIKDFDGWLTFHLLTRGINEAMTGNDSVTMKETIIWVDDGKHNVTINVSQPSTTKGE